MLGQGIEIDMVSEKERLGLVGIGWRGLSDCLAKRRLIKAERDDQDHLRHWHTIAVRDKRRGDVAEGRVARRGLRNILTFRCACRHSAAGRRAGNPRFDGGKGRQQKMADPDQPGSGRTR